MKRKQSRARRRTVADLFVVPNASDSPKIASDGRPPDWEERERALDVEQSWIVEAPAGSGKTGLLIQRYLKLLAHESVEEPEQVLAITFTVKATAEIRERVVAQLERAARGETLRDDNNFERETRTLAEAVLRRDELLGWQLLEHPRRLNMRTIDSVCAEIARSLPVLSGGGGGQTPVLDASLLYREAARQTLMQLGGADAALNEALRTVLLHRDGNLAECELLVAGMLEWRDQWGDLFPLSRQDLDDAYLDGTVLPKLQLALEQAVCAGLIELNQSLPPDILEELSRLANELGHAEGYRGAPSPIAILAGLDNAPGETAEDLEHWQALIHLLTKASGEWRSGFRSDWLRFELGKTHAARLKSLVEDLRERDDVLRAIKRVNSLPPQKYPQEQWVVAKALFRVLSRALAELQIVFAQRGECDFAELGLLARTALGREGGVRDLSEALGRELRHLLVDEMQDTSTSQYELIQLLTQGWDGHGQTVFLVGDPKQSIYLFRQARVERFVRTMQTEMLGDLPLGRLQLTANFRSQSELVDAFNEDFALLFPREVGTANPEEVAYFAAQAVKGPSRNDGLGVVWHTAVLRAGSTLDNAKRAKRRQAKQDAQQVRAIVQKWRARALPEGRREPWKIAVLVRSRAHLLDVVAALKEDDGEGPIPFRAVDIEPLKDRQEVLDLSALTRALLHPADRVAWLAVLHAPWCGLGLAELHILAGADDPDWAQRCVQDVIDERAHLLSERGCERLARVWPVLQAAADQRGKLTTAQWVERTWRSLGGDAWLTVDEMANARRYLQLLDEVEEQAAMLDLRLLERRIDKLYAETAVVAGAVDLMTIHGAKGLEWDVVMVPGLERRAQANRNRLLTWSEIDSGDEEAAHVALAPIASKGEGSLELNAWLNGIHNAREAAERKRLFYVACTRAREELHLFAAPEENAKGEVKPIHGSLLATAWPAAKRHFAGAPMVSDAAAKALVMQPSAAMEDEFFGDIAAAGAEAMEATQRPAKLQRLPRQFDPRERFRVEKKLSYGEADDAQNATHFARPEGSFEARALGNAVHVFLEMLAKRLGDGVPRNVLLSEVAEWNLRIAAVLRGEGLPQASARKQALRVQSALRDTLADAEGLWVLSAHESAASEYALTSWGDRHSSVRLDRVFRAGPEPLTAATNCLWIVDYKTTTHGSKGVEEFLAEERQKYGPQMLAYAQMMRGEAEPGKLRVGLYYPMLPRLVWWIPEME
jgi:ATP-dependent exoDNAse (exonuclease V) beta subunit